jgi:hypothetical protein
VDFAQVNIKLFNRVLADFAQHLEWANTSVLFWQSTKPVGIPVSGGSSSYAFI